MPNTRTHTPPPPGITDSPHDDGDDAPVLHIVDGWRETVVVERLGRLLPRRFRPAPRALCGQIMWGDPDRPDLPPFPLTPICPACVQASGRDPETITASLTHTPGYWL